MEEKKRKILLICLEVICLAILLPVFYWATLKLLLFPIADAFYSSISPTIPLWLFVMLTFVFDAGWIMLMTLCPKSERHAKVILTLLVLTFSASLLSTIAVCNALEGVFS